MKQSTLHEISIAIFDKRLFGFTTFIWRSGPLLALGFITEISIYLILNPQMLFIYIPLFFMLILVSGLGAKNYAMREVNNMGYFRGFLFLLVSVLASTTPFIFIQPKDPLTALFQFLLLFAVSVLALTIAIVEVTVYGQRVSLRKSMNLEEDFFKKQKRIWEEKLADFSNLDKIISAVDDCRFVATLFDRGSFNLAVLWSCNAMEKIVDAVAEAVTSSNPERKTLFRKEASDRLGYPKQSKNLGFQPQ